MHNDVQVIVGRLQRKEMVASPKAFIGHTVDLPLESTIVLGLVERTQYILTGNAQVGHSATHVFTRN